MGPTGQTVTMFLRGKAEERDSVCTCVSVCPSSLCVKSLSETMCRACMRVKFSPMKHRCPLQLHPPLSPWDDDADSDW